MREKLQILITEATEVKTDIAAHHSESDSLANNVLRLADAFIALCEAALPPEPSDEVPGTYDLPAQGVSAAMPADPMDAVPAMTDSINEYFGIPAE